MEQKLTFEKAIGALEEIVSRLEKGQTSLEETLEYYKKGMELAAFCGEQLKSAKLTLLQYQPEKPQEEQADE